MVVGAHQSFQFLRQKTWFLENNTFLSKFLYGILHYLISHINYKKPFHKTQIHANHASHLKTYKRNIRQSILLKYII